MYSAGPGTVAGMRRKNLQMSACVATFRSLYKQIAGIAAIGMAIATHGSGGYRAVISKPRC
jgi:hypothetical protein